MTFEKWDGLSAWWKCQPASGKNINVLGLRPEIYGLVTNGSGWVFYRLMPGGRSMRRCCIL